MSADARRRAAVTLSAALLGALISASSAPALAGGFYFADRGARPLSRGGAFIAGVDDPHALWYNPAGLAYSGNQVLIDGTLTFFEVDYTRIDGGGERLPTVTGSSYFPIPTLGGSFQFDALPEFTFGVALMAPNAALMQWPEQIEIDGEPAPAPQRYSLLSLEGTGLATVALGAAYQPIPELSIGLGTHLLFGSFAARVALSACDGAVCSFPEDPDYDGVAQIELPVFAPIFVLGTTVDLGFIRFGASFSTPFDLAGTAGLSVRPPSAAAFDGSRVVNRDGDCAGAGPDNPCVNDTRADVSLAFPWALRFGVEVRPVPELRVEAAVVVETWSMQDEARIRPRDVWIEDALGFLDYEIGPISIPRRMKDTVSIRLGGAYTIEDTVTISLGGYYENGAFDDETLTALTIDSDKFVFGGGAAIRLSPEVLLDLVVGYVWMRPREVRDSIVPQSNPIRPPPPDGGEMRSPGDAVFIGNGDYDIRAPFFGLGVRWQLDPPRGPAADAAAAASAEAEPEGPPEAEVSSDSTIEEAPEGEEGDGESDAPLA